LLFYSSSARQMIVLFCPEYSVIQGIARNDSLYGDRLLMNVMEILVKRQKINYIIYRST
jgi:hypothetical protein